MINKNLLIIFFVIALTIVVSIYYWSSNNRYYMITNTNGFIVQLDKKTGNMWRMDRMTGNLIKMHKHGESQNYEKSNKNTKSAATKDKAFLNSTWKMSPNEIWKVTGLRLVEVNLDNNKYTLYNVLPDIVDTGRLKIMKFSKPIKLHGIYTHVAFYFFDEKLFAYNIINANDIHDKSVYDSFYNNLKTKFGDPLKTDIEKFTLNINWKSDKQNVRYIFSKTGDTNLSFLDITFEYLPFIVEINKISKGEKEEYF